VPRCVSVCEIVLTAAVDFSLLKWNEPPMSLPPLPTTPYFNLQPSPPAQLIIHPLHSSSQLQQQQQHSNISLIVCCGRLGAESSPRHGWSSCPVSGESVYWLRAIGFRWHRCPRHHSSTTHPTPLHNHPTSAMECPPYWGEGLIPEVGGRKGEVIPTSLDRGCVTSC